VRVRVVHGTHQLQALPAQTPHQFNFGHELRRVNATQRPPREPTRVQRLAHVVLQTTKPGSTDELALVECRNEESAL
jgi:hypothetical protein